MPVFLICLALNAPIIPAAAGDTVHILILLLLSVILLDNIFCLFFGSCFYGDTLKKRVYILLHEFVCSLKLTSRAARNS